MRGLLGRYGNRQRVGISQADVFASENHQPAGDEHHIFTRFEHAR